MIIGTTKNCILLANLEQDDKEFQYLTKVTTPREYQMVFRDDLASKIAHQGLVV